jgi:hypothetical protein
MTRAASQRHRRLHLRRSHGRGDNLSGQRVENEVIAGMRAQKFCDARLCSLQTVNGFDPNRPSARKIAEDIVGLVHNSSISGSRQTVAKGEHVWLRSAIPRPIVRREGHASHFKPRSYSRIVTASQSVDGGYVNRVEVLYIFRNRRQLLRLRAPYGVKVVYGNARSGLPAWIERNLIAISRSLDKMCEA